MKLAFIMSEDRYEIKGKLGQGGVGAVYRAYDQNLNREVAIKRLLPDEDFTDKEGASEGLIQEAKALSSINHPHIVSVYDAGVDVDGPYVIMELLNGKTLDDMIMVAPLTLEDFREVAIQSQEAMIAAQDLDIVHRDIKPGNVMVIWLPSGKFQIKLLDFGLAKFTPAPSLQTIDNGDAVMGSIHFMAPEQFERIPLDKRTDMYSLGCLYYYALTQKYPFDGETAPQVMTSHLQHKVIDLAEYRPDLPAWLCKWVMWHINHNMGDRPEGARIALEHFLTCEADPSAPLPFTVVAADGTRSNLSTPAPRKARLIMPGAPQPAGESPSNVTPITASQPILPPDASRPSIHTTAQKIKTSLLQKAEEKTTPITSAPSENTPKPAPVLTVSKPVLTPVTLQKKGTTTAPAQAPNQGSESVGSVEPSPVTALPKPPKKKLSNTAKVVIAASMGVMVIFGGILFLKKLDTNRKIQALNELTAPFQNGRPTELPLSGKQVQLLLDEAASAGEKKDRETYYEALRIGQATDSTDIDLEIAKFVTKHTNMSDEVRKKLFKVIELRGNEVALPLLIDYAKSGKPAATNALAAARKMATPANFGDFLAIISDTKNEDIRREAERTLGSGIANSPDPTRYDSKLVEIYKSTENEELKEVYLRLMGFTGGPESAETIKENLKNPLLTAQIAAVNAASKWTNRDLFDLLLQYTADVKNPTLRADAFKTLLHTLDNTEETPEHSDQTLLTAVFDLATQDNEKLQMMSALVRSRTPWALELLKKYEEDGQPDKIIYQAERGVRALERALKESEK